jgi:hypothetical protein
VNDSRALLRSGCPAPAPRCDNCAFVELHLQGWPVIALVTTAPVSLGEELLASHGPQYWDYVKDAQGRLNQVLRRTGMAAVAAVAAAAPAAETVSEAHGDSAAVPPPAASVRASRHVLQVDGKAKCAVVVTAQGGAASAAVPPFPAAFALNVTATTSGDNAATSIKPLLATGAWDGQLLLVAGATPADVAKLASLAAALDKKGKAAFVVDCDGGTQADAGRRLYFVPAGRVADAVLSGFPAAALAPPPGSFIALVFAPARRAVAPAYAPAEQAGTASADSIIHLSSRSHAAKPPAPAPQPAPVLDLPPAAAEAQAACPGAAWHCTTCGLANDATHPMSCRRCCFLRAAVPAAQQPPSCLADRNLTGGYVESLVKVLRSAAPASLPMAIPRLQALIELERRAKAPMLIIKRYGTLLALLQAHGDLFAVEASAADDPRTPGRVRLRASTTPDPASKPSLPSSHQPPHGCSADSWTCPTCGYGNDAVLPACHRCGFLPAAVPAAQQTAFIERKALAAFLDSLVTVLRAARPSSLPVSTARLNALAVKERGGIMAPVSVVNRYGTLLAFLQAHGDIFALETLADEDPRTPGNVRLRASATPDPVREPYAPPSHPPLALPRFLPPAGASAGGGGLAVGTWKCPTCDIRVPDHADSKYCTKCKWQRGPTSAVVQASMHACVAAAAEQDGYAATLIAVLRGLNARSCTIRSLSYYAWTRLHGCGSHAPQSAVERYGTLAAFLAARPADFQLLPPAASQDRRASTPAYGLVDLTDRARAGCIAPAAQALPPPPPPPPPDSHGLALAAAPPDLVCEPPLPPSHPQLPSQHALPPPAGAASSWTCPTCGNANGASQTSCRGCRFLPAAVSAVQQESACAPDRTLLRSYVDSLVKVLRSAAPASLPMAMPRLHALVDAERKEKKAPVSIINHFGPLLALLQAHGDLFVVELSADDDPRTPGRVRLCTRATMHVPDLTQHGGLADPWCVRVMDIAAGLRFADRAIHSASRRTCPTCDRVHPGAVQYWTCPACDRCKWQREATSAAVQASTHNSAAEVAEQDRYAAALITVLRGTSGNCRICSLSLDSWIRMRTLPPQSAVERFGTLAAFLAARPADFQLLPSSAYQGRARWKPAYFLVALTDGAHAGSVAPAAAPVLPSVPPMLMPTALMQQLPPAPNPASPLRQPKRAAEGGDPAPAKAARDDEGGNSEVEPAKKNGFKPGQRCTCLCGCVDDWTPMVRTCRVRTEAKHVLCNKCGLAQKRNPDGPCCQR